MDEIRSQLDRIKSTLTGSMVRVGEAVNAVVDGAAFFISQTCRSEVGNDPVETVESHVLQLCAALERLRGAVAGLEQQRDAVAAGCAELGGFAEQVRHLAAVVRNESQPEELERSHLRRIADNLDKMASDAAESTAALRSASDKLQSLLSTLEEARGASAHRSDRIMQSFVALRQESHARVDRCRREVTNAVQQLKITAQDARAQLICEDVIMQGLEELEALVCDRVGLRDAARYPRSVGAAYPDLDEEDLRPGEAVSW